MNLETLFEKFDLFANAPNAVVKMREMVLQLAFTGRLLNERLDRDSSRQLLAQIDEEKASLVEQGKIKKLNTLFPFPKHYDSDGLPPSWSLVPLGRTALILVDGSHNPPPKSSVGIPMLSSQNILNGKITFEASRLISEDDYSFEQQRVPVAAGDVLLTIVGTIGRSAVVSHELPRFALQRSVAVVRSRLDPTFLSYYLQSPQAFFYYDAHAKGTAQRGLYLGTLSEMPVPVASLAEQKRIVAKVDELMALCDRLEAQQWERETRHAALSRASLARFADAPTTANLNFIFHKSYNITPADLRKTILTLAVQGKLVPQDPDNEPVSDLLTRELTARKMLVKQGEICAEEPLKSIKAEEQPAEIPSGWAWCKIDHLIHSLRNDIRTGPFGSSLHKNEHKAFGVPVWGIESIGKDGSFTGLNKIFVDIIKARELASFTVKGGDIIISRSGTVGELCRLPDGIPAGLISTNLMKISLNKRVINPDYFCLLFRGAISINVQLSQLCFGSTRLFLTQKILTKLLFPLPPLSEQNRIVTKVDELMALVDALETKLATARTVAEKLMEAVVAELTSQQSTRMFGCGETRKVGGQAWM